MQKEISVHTPLPESHKGGYPFKLATTSFIYRAGWAENARMLGPYVDEIELVIFESNPSSWPGDAEIRHLSKMSEACGITYHVHLPIDLKVGSSDPGARDRAVERIRRCIAATGILDPAFYTVHLDAEGDMENPENVRSWQDRTRDSLERILSDGLPPERLTVENLDYPFEIAAAVFQGLGIGICFDVGHMLLLGGDVAKAFDKYRQSIKIVHLYGPGSAGEHISLSELPEDLAGQMVRRLEMFSGTVSLEVFSYDHFAGSLDHMAHLWQKYAGGKSP